MPSVHEILKQTGMTDEQIAALDAKVVNSLTEVVTVASREREQAELAKRAQEKQYADEIVPAINTWANEKAQLEARVAFYKTQADGAKANGFLAADAPNEPPPTTTTVRDQTGKFVTGAPGAVPGSPTYMTREDGFAAVSNATWAIQEHMRLYGGQPLPEDLDSLAREASSQRIPFKDFVAKKFKFAEKREEIKAAEQKKHDDTIRQEEREKTVKEIAERTGNNPDLRRVESSKFSEVRSAVKAGERADPLKMNVNQRRQATRESIHKDVASHAVN